MATVTDDMFNELFTRMRENEAQTREQQVKIEALTDKIEAQNERIAGFTEITDTFIKEIKAREERAERREGNFWKVIYVLLGTIISLAVGPKVAKDILSFPTSPEKLPLTLHIVPIAPMPDNHHHIYRIFQAPKNPFIV